VSIDAAPTIISADWLLPITTEPIRNGAVLIRHGAISAYGALDAVRGVAPPDVNIDHQDRAILMPGFVNAHTHLELTCYHDQLQRTPLWEWFDELIPIRRTTGAEQREAEGIQRAVEMCLAAGVTTVGDITRTGASIKALRDAPLRKVCFLELISGASQPPSSFDELVTMFDHLHSELNESKAPYTDRLQLGISPHAPYTVRPTEIAACMDFACKRDIPITMHLLETKEESDWLRGRGATLQTILDSRGLATGDNPPTNIEDWYAQTKPLERGLLAHMNYADDADIQRISDASVVWCPRAHAYFGHRNHPWQRMIEEGVNVCIGTDSLASNDSLSILDELRFVAKHHPACDLAMLLASGTINPARALGMGEKIGAIELRKRADLVAIDWDENAPPEPTANIIHGAGSVRATWIDGTQVFQRQ